MKPVMIWSEPPMYFNNMFEARRMLSHKMAPAKVNVNSQAQPQESRGGINIGEVLVAGVVFVGAIYVLFKIHENYLASLRPQYPWLNEEAWD